MTTDVTVGHGDRSLKRTIGLYGAVSLALGIVVGAGMLSLPGLVYAHAGGWGVYAWLLDAALVLPLLFVFAVLGRRFPSAGGVAGFVGQAFPILKPGCAFLLVGTFSLGLPGIAVTGAGYVVAGLDLIDPAGGNWILTGVAAGIIAAVLIMGWIGAKLAGVVQNVIVTLLVLALGFVAASSVSHWPGIDFAAGDPTWPKLWSGMALAFFAYTGWEMLAFTAEEFKNPRRDFPIAVALSFAVVLALYVGAALAVQALVPLDDPRLAAAPLMVVVATTLTSGVAGQVLAVVVLCIILANLNGAIWAASRLLFDIGRSGWAPQWLSLSRLDGSASTPRRAVLALGVLLTAVLYMFGAGWFELADLLRIAGQNFFLLYTLCIIAYIKVETGMAARTFGAIALAVCVAFTGVFGWGLLYAAGLFVLPYLFRGSTQRLVRERVRASSRTDTVRTGRVVE